MASSGGGRRKRLAAHLEAALAEVERLADAYRVGIERLEGSVHAGLSCSAVRQWFLMVRGCRWLLVTRSCASFAESVSTLELLSYCCSRVCAQFLRVVDLGVQIRRGEIRHRTTRQFVHPCMHTTGTKGAIHSGTTDSWRLTRLASCVLLPHLTCSTMMSADFRSEHR